MFELIQAVAVGNFWIGVNPRFSTFDLYDTFLATILGTTAHITRPKYKAKKVSGEDGCLVCGGTSRAVCSSVSACVGAAISGHPRVAHTAVAPRLIRIPREFWRFANFAGANRQGQIRLDGRTDDVSVCEGPRGRSRCNGGSCNDIEVHP